MNCKLEKRMYGLQVLPGPEPEEDRIIESMQIRADEELNYFHLQGNIKINSKLSEKEKQALKDLQLNRKGLYILARMLKQDNYCPVNFN